MFQITFVSEILTVLQAIIVMLENILTLPNLHISHKIHNVLLKYLSSVLSKGVMKMKAIRFCARTEFTVNAVQVHLSKLKCRGKVNLFQ